MDDLYPVTLMNNENKFVWLTSDQLSAVLQRDQIKCKDLGINLDLYMSLIDPDYPVS